MPIFSSYSVNPLGAPWRMDNRGYIYRSDSGLIGTIRHGDFQTPDVVVQWLCGAAEVAGALYPLSLEATSHIKDISRGIMALTDALQAMLNAHDPVLSQVCEGGFGAPKWWTACREYTALARTQVAYDGTEHRFLHEDWKHRLGWEERVQPGVRTLQAHGLLDDFKTMGDHSTGQWDGTSFLYGANSKRILFQTDKRALDKDCPPAIPLFCKFLRRILHQARADNPLAPPEILKHLADAIMATKVNSDAINSTLDVCQGSRGGDADLIKKAKTKLKKLKDITNESRKGTEIETVLAMPHRDRTDYYRSVRRSDVKIWPDTRQSRMLFF